MAASLHRLALLAAAWGLALGMALAPAVHAAGVAAADNDAATQIEHLFRNGQNEQAFARIDSAIQRQPNDPALRFLRGVMLSESRREREATEVFERLTQDFPELPEPFNNLAVLMAAQGRIDRARELLETALRNDPGYRTAQRNLGDVFSRLALRAYEAAAHSVQPDAALQRSLALARQLAIFPAPTRP